MGAVSLTDITTWLSSAALVAILGLLSKHWLAIKKDRLTAYEVERGGFTTLIGELQKEVVRLRDQHSNCESRLSAMDGAIQAMQLQILTISFNNGKDATPELKEALAEIVRGKNSE